MGRDWQNQLLLFDKELLGTNLVLLNKMDPQKNSNIRKLTIWEIIPLRKW
ncbi:hypothetical protein RchiOBHm_Chr7g0228741 [Rosa chinensis]|uniref:Uncharacterized protein n=1 Tax=Rosa chinensis TaxID=74649 RepID=A0A2P6PEY9_ROSCH|nr:hypothetical protein RchiOBHm_Chr7g0228741 [Rosa chinensis]